MRLARARTKGASARRAATTMQNAIFPSTCLPASTHTHEHFMLYAFMPMPGICYHSVRATFGRITSLTVRCDATRTPGRLDVDHRTRARAAH